MIHVICVVQLVPGKRDEFLQAFHALMPAVHAEDGCIEYGPTIDAETTIGAQVPRRPDVVTLIEKWRDLKALEAHLAAPHMTPYRATVKPIIDNTKLYVLETA